MSWLLRSLQSSIGKKFIMAVTGVSLMIFLKVHLINNLFLFLGPEAFDQNVAMLDGIKPLIRVVEVILATIIIFHIYNGTKLWLENKKANPQKYAVNKSSENSSVFSRTMFLTGSAVFIFLAVHLGTMWRTFNFGDHHHKYYDIVADAFANPFIAGFYLIAMGLLAFHLNHGFQSAFQTFGWTHKKYSPLIKALGTIYSVGISVGFATVPIYFYIASLGGK